LLIRFLRMARVLVILVQSHAKKRRLNYNVQYILHII
jgi:hypothetical protein